MWPQGFSWTKGYDTIMKNPDGTMYHAVGKGGPVHLQGNPDWRIAFFQMYNQNKYDHWHTRQLARIGIGFTNFGMAFRPFRAN